MLLNKLDSPLMGSLADTVRCHSCCECMRLLSSQTSLISLFIWDATQAGGSKETLCLGKMAHTGGLGMEWSPLFLWKCIWAQLTCAAVNCHSCFHDKNIHTHIVGLFNRPIHVNLNLQFRVFHKRWLMAGHSSISSQLLSYSFKSYVYLQKKTIKLISLNIENFVLKTVFNWI